ncbi:hypothetical protein MA13_contig00011-0061 [Edwardsiella piscicida]|nr:hypothetical protein MA13_contig00011-0061 [Edwardsiella piscicida]
MVEPRKVSISWLAESIAQKMIVNDSPIKNPIINSFSTNRDKDDISCGITSVIFIF